MQLIDYDIAQICLNGHLINAAARSVPVHNKNYCEKCGEKTIANCPQCKLPIQGVYINRARVHYKDLITPAYCCNCGNPFPWTEKALFAAKALAEEFENVSEEDKAKYRESVGEIGKDSPATMLAAARISNVLMKVGDVCKCAFREIMINIASETAKKILWPS